MIKFRYKLKFIFMFLYFLKTYFQFRSNYDLSKIIYYLINYYAIPKFSRVSNEQNVLNLFD